MTTVRCMGVPEFDQSDWPVVRVAFDLELKPDEVQSYLQRCAEVLGRRERVGLLIDARRAAIPDAKTRARFAEFFAEQSPLTRRYVAGMAVVLTTAMGRGVVTALSWMQGPTFPVKSFEFEDAARRWLDEQLGR